MKKRIRNSLFSALLAASLANAQDVYTQYAPYLTRNGGLLNSGTEWATSPTGTWSADVYWGQSANWPVHSTIEEHAVKFNCNSGHPMIWVSAYRDYDTGFRYPISTTKAYYWDLTTSTRYDMTNPGSCATLLPDGSWTGQPYALYNVWNAPYQIQVWGNVYDIWGNLGKRWYWDATFINYVSESNSCIGGTPNATTILQKETYWDSSAGWYHPFPGLSTLQQPAGDMTAPGDHSSNGPGTGAFGVEPAGTNDPYSRYQTIGKGYGFSWTYGGFPAGADTHSNTVQRTQEFCMTAYWNW